MPEYSFPLGWGRFWVIGDLVFTQAIAWLCLEEVTGRVVGVDVELNEPIYAVNSSVERMVRCMKLLADGCRSSRGSMTQSRSWIDTLSRDPDLPEGEAEPFWIPIIVGAIENECERMRVEIE